MTKQFDLEQAILESWNILDDLKLFRELLDTKDFASMSSTHFKGLLSEYEFRYKRKHKSGTVCLQIVSTPPEGITNVKLTAPARCMDTRSRSVSTDPVECYRHYYKTQKSNILRYSVRPAPAWIE